MAYHIVGTPLRWWYDTALAGPARAGAGVPTVSDVMLEELAAVLGATGCQWDASEAHGTLVGLVCADPQTPVARWISEIERAGETDPAAVRGDLGDIGDRTMASVRDEQFEFRPLLPDDDVDIGTRTAALAQWCQGFLYGFALTGQNPMKDGTGDVPEVMADLAEITRAEVDDEVTAEVAEAAYAELVEFVRVAVQLVYYELATARQPAPPSEDT